MAQKCIETENTKTVRSLKILWVIDAVFITPQLFEDS